jgi:hypothetical protein
VEHVKNKDLAIKESKLLKEDETVQCRVLKLKKPSDRKVSKSNDGVDHMAPEFEEPVEVKGEITDLIESTRSSPSTISEKDEYSVMDKDNFKYGELERTNGSNKNVENNKLENFNEVNQEVKNPMKLKGSLETSNKETSWSRSTKNQMSLN